MSRATLLEIAVESPEGAWRAQLAGAERLELCANLSLGGTTPSLACLERTLTRTSLPVMVLLRPRAGDFVYSAEELAIVHRELELCREAGAAGVVFGALTGSGHVDLQAMRELVELAHPLPVTFHRAFDFTLDLNQALEDLIGLGVGRVLTSGGAASARAGAQCLRQLVEKARGRIAILAGGGVRADHVSELVRATGVAEVHASGVCLVASRERARPNAPQLASSPIPDESTRYEPDDQRIRELRSALATCASAHDWAAKIE